MTAAAPALAQVDRGWDWTTPDDDAAVEVVLGHRRIFHALADDARALSTRGHHDAAAGLAVAAGECAWLHHGGAFADLELERVLGEIGDTLPARRAPTGRWGGDVLHVLTSAHPTGGHTRLAARWIETDRGRRPTVVLTGQAGRPVPTVLAAAMERSQGRLSILDAGRHGARERAAVLRHLADAHDFVILHTHPSDVVPTLAFTRMPGGPRVVTLNHADHVFWLGMTISHAVACLRPVGADLSIRRRGLEAERALSLPVPIPEPQVAGDKRRAVRHALGVPDDALLLLSAATAYKYATTYGGPHFAEVLAEACLAIPELRVLVAGPSSTAEWALADARTGGHIRALGIRHDLDDLLAAADLYMDSFPLGSSTSALEAGAAGLPVISLPVWLQHLPLATCHSDALDRVMVTARDRDSLINLLRDFAADRAATTALGASTRTEILRSHGGEVWRTHLEALYASVAAIPPAAPQPVDNGARTDPCDLILARMLTGRWGGLGFEVSTLPLRPRLTSAIRYLRSGGNGSPHLLALLMSYPQLRGMKRLVRFR